MSTRATYEFKSGPGCWGAKSVTFYIHCDGYPEGAAHKFALALAYKPAAPNSNFADCFYRANDRAEFTDGHDAHGDTEYRYTVTQDGPWRELDAKRKPLRIVAEDIVGFDDGPRPTKVLFDGALSEFIAQAAVLS